MQRALTLGDSELVGQELSFFFEHLSHPLGTTLTPPFLLLTDLIVTPQEQTVVWMLWFLLTNNLRDWFWFGRFGFGAALLGLVDFLLPVDLVSVH